jgi:hypothetical protein
MRRWFLIALVALVVGTVAISFHQPPMRLMPTPAVLRDGLPDIFAPAPGTARDNRIEVFYVTNRLAVGPRNDRLYAVVPGRDLNVGIASMAIGEETTTWDEIHAWSRGLRDDRRPFIRLTRMAELGSIVDGAPDPQVPLTPGTRAWLTALDTALEKHRDKDIIIYVHGANATVERAAGQAAQLQHFTGNNSIVLLFCWPTAENFLRYSRDMVTAYGAAPQLARTIDLIARHTRARNIDVLTYSAGGTVGSDGLAMAGRAANAGGQNPRLGEVYHAAPDADTRGFVDDLKDYVRVTRRVTVAANMGDSALRLSALINRASRAGRPDMAELSPEATAFLLDANKAWGLEVVRVRPEDIPGLARGSHTFWYDDPWVSSDVLLKLLFELPPAQRGLVAGQVGEGTYWQFPQDYEARLPGVVATIKADQARLKAPVSR